MEPLYDHSPIKITPRETGENEHDLMIGKNYILLQRGILKDLAGRVDTEGLASCLRNFHPTIDAELSENKIDFPRLHVAMSQARMVELEAEVGYFIDEARKYKSELDEIREAR